MRLTEIFGANVRRVRKARGMTLETLATEAGLAYSYMGGIERGQKNPSLNVAEKIAKVLESDPATLFCAPPKAK
ncbi:XRE family transcriptional regulator [Mesorhizobium sp. M4B.F.Ca.ET.215.01.1.1]|uniref:helix-turn-helix domain-containing protein n=1 Tax=unclassified Mesorhizobium TaxID=325217 RepID=UPI000FD30896|nr:MULTISPECIES: helix-turn-helix transcriptional regulator [unclassified Mesorhizobium]RUX69411.1 XRE family transcriptional regulator [Mesorhizobium sp. M2A.F.Ca.ET.040.01.1.1]RVC63827.1 XRE family transcriptional regulator [Mesorhizobium sp. M4B.F.Ca.ET.088.02.2.1]RUW23707.1 XRE family transcriptional regulator [Mesorhizobium sp. M4B.F.Ca.ET.013.02.1.1]RWF29579.1 MAG: XRE family transcriptional regulator [Mesorhizobium sp.]RWF41939.1 MAG: XRE family transcriptional regulator [Mesorhizobium 